MENLRSILIFIFLFSGISISAQETTVRIRNISSFIDKNGETAITTSDGDYTIFAVTDSGQRVPLVQYQSGEFLPDHGEGDYNVPESISSFSIEGRIVDVGGFCQPGSGTVPICTSLPPETPRVSIDDLIANSCTLGQQEEVRLGFSFSTGDGTNLSAALVINFEYDIIPVIEVESVPAPGQDVSEIIAAIDLPLTYRATPNNLDSAAYVWEYQVGNTFGNGWRPLIDNDSNPADITFIPGDYEASPGNPIDINDVGRDLNVRVRSCSEIGSNVVSQQLSLSAPTIVRTEPLGPVCSDSNDERIRVFFSRNLLSGERLEVAVSLLGDNYNEVANFSYDTDDVTNDDGNFINNSEIAPEPFIELSDKNGENDFISGGNYRIVLIGFAPNGANTFTGDVNHSREGIIIPETTPVTYSVIEKNDTSCFGGSDGSFVIEAQGGSPGQFQYSRNNGSTWVNFSGGTNNGTTSQEHTVDGLTSGPSRVKVRKVPSTSSNIEECLGTINVGNNLDDPGISIVGNAEETDAYIRVSIGFPPPIQVVVNPETKIHPTASGFENGIITVNVIGGTPGTSGYNYRWYRDEELVATGSAIPINEDEGAVVQLTNAGAGDYYIRVEDSNYVDEDSGCYTEYELGELREPEPLVVSIEETNSISCNTGNLEGNSLIPDSLIGDGELVAYAQGGVQLDVDSNGPIRIDDPTSDDGVLFDGFTNNLPYIFIWKKRNDETGEMEVINMENSNVLRNQTAGLYSVNIIDANGITIGEYTFASDGNPNGVTPTDETHLLEEPPAILLTFSKVDISCSGGNTGSATVFIEGGEAPYDIEWAGLVEKSQTVQNLFAGSQAVFVTDAKGCRVSGNVVIEQPNGLDIEVVSSVNPTCFEGSDGQIEVLVTGGAPPYELSWNNGSSSSSLNNLEAGTYVLNLEDNNGCNASIEVTLEDPEEFIIDLGPDRTLCLDQTHQINLDSEYTAGATYAWESDNGFTSTSSQVEFSESGIYTVTVTSALGCIATDEVVINVSDAPIDSYFLLTTQAFTNEEVILVNVSDPIGETVEWTVPDGVRIVDEAKEGITLVFPDSGSYEIGLRSFQGECYEDFSNLVIVEEATDLRDVGDADDPFISEFLIFPNPNNGSFEVKLSFAEQAEISVKVISLITSQVVSTIRMDGSSEYLEPITLNNLPSGLYMLLLETPRGDEVRKVVIQ